MQFAICAALLVVGRPFCDEAREITTRSQARNLLRATLFYHDRTGQWPRVLTDVKPYLDAGQDKFFSSWGYPFQYTLKEDEAGKVVPYIWTEREVNGEARVYGKKPPEEK
jgi:hypothetical protein